MPIRWASFSALKTSIAVSYTHLAISLHIYLSLLNSFELLAVKVLLVAELLTSGAELSKDCLLYTSYIAGDSITVTVVLKDAQGNFITDGVVPVSYTHLVQALPASTTAA